MKPARNTKGEYARTNTAWIPLLGVTLATTIGIQTLGLSIKAVKQEAEINYLKAYSRSIELQGLRHWNTMYSLSLHKYDQPKDVKQIIDFVFQDKAPEAIKVFSCESGLKSNAVNKNRNGSTDVGIAQINSVHDINPEYLKDAWVNLTVAKAMYDRQSWNPWVCASKLGIK